MSCTHARNKNKPCQKDLCPIFNEELGHTANIPVIYRKEVFDPRQCVFLKSTSNKPEAKPE